MSPQNSYAEILVPNVVVLEVETFGRYLDYD